MPDNTLLLGIFFYILRNYIKIMEFKKGSIVVTKDGEYILKEVHKMVNPFSLEYVLVFMVDIDGNERAIQEKDVIKVKNNHLDNIEEPSGYKMR